MSNDQLNKITDFLLPNRQVWQNVDVPGGNVDTDADSDIDSNIDANTDTDTEKKESTDDFTQMVKIIKQAESECDTAKKTICSLKDMKENVWDVKEVNRLRKFIDDLDDKFLVEGEGAEKMRYTSDRLKRLEQELDMEAIIKEFLNSKSYKIVTYTNSQTDKDPELNDHILFEYKDGTKKKFPLEMSLNPPALVSTAAHVLRRTEAISNQAAAENRWRKSHPMADPWKKWRAEWGRPRPMADPWKAWRAEYENVGQNAQDEKSSEEKKESSKGRDKKPNRESVNTPKKAYSKLKKIAPNVPDDLLAELSVPLSNVASNPSDGESQYEMINEIFRKYYGVRGYFDIRDTDPVAFNDLRKIWKNFDF